MPVSIGAKPESGFDDPIGLMTDCHRRIESFLEALSKAAQSAAGRKLKDSERSSVEKALRYFRESGPRHNADEEDSLFPRMRVAPSDEVLPVLTHVSQLEADHQQASGLHGEVEELYRRWLNKDALAPNDTQHLQESLETLSGLYKRHIALEESDVFPLARRILDGSTQQAMGREMKSRRGLAS